MKTIPAMLIERAHGLAGEIRSRAQEIDSASKLPDDLVRKFVDLELVSTLVPRRFGGHECALGVAAQIIEIVAAADMAAAWVLAFYIGHNFIHCQFPEQAQREIFANGPSPCSAGVLAPTLQIRPVEGGYRVSGRNGWNSGSPHADWILGAGMAVEADGSKTPLCIIVPRVDVTLVDTWDVQGMRATGSWDAVFEDVFVPAHRTLSAAGLMQGVTPGSAIHDNPFYRRPLILVTFIYSLAPFLGGLRGVMEDYLAATGKRVGTNDGKVGKEKPTAHMRAGRGATHVWVAQTLFNQMLADATTPQADMDVAGRFAFKAQSAFLTSFCKDAVNDLVLGAGANAFRSQSPLQTAFRNINMISVHAFFDLDGSMESHGRMVLGLEPNAMI